MTAGTCKLRPLFLLALLASSACLSCSSPPAGRRMPVLTTGSRHPPPGSGGASSAPTPDGTGQNASVDAGGEPIPSCTALALCCSSLDMSDPFKGWCEEALSASTPDQCEAALPNFGCAQ